MSFSRRSRQSLALIVVLMSGVSAVAGDIEPPSGAVVATMKPLSDVEPRIAINGTNTPGDADSLYKITEPGSYYLTQSVIGTPGKCGVEIASDDVTVDLAGMQLEGSAGSLSGIVTSFEAESVRVVNGALRGWGGHAVDLTGPGGVVSNVRVSGNAAGIRVSHGALVHDCVAQDNTGIGIQLAGGGGVVRDCTARSNNGVGIAVSTHSVVQNCSVLTNGSSGISAVGGVAISHCTAVQNGLCGIVAVENSSIDHCVAVGNTTDGICVTVDCRVAENTCRYNGLLAAFGAGIRALGPNNRIEANLVTFNDAGIMVDVAGNFIVKNAVADNAPSNYEITGTQTIGPIITATGTITTTNPWANFSY